MRKLWLIAERQFLTQTWSADFTLALFLPPLALALALGVMVLLRHASAARRASPPAALGALRPEPIPFAQAVGLVDAEGLIAVVPADIPAGQLVRLADEAAAAEAVRAGRIAGYYVVRGRDLDRREVIFYGERVIFLGTDRAITRLVEHNLAQAGGAELAARLTEPLRVTAVTVTPRAGGGARGTTWWAGLALAFGIQYVLMLPVSMTAGMVLGGITHLKRRGVLEILVASAPPWAVLLGTLLGAVMAGLLLLGAWLGWALALGGWLAPPLLAGTAPAALALTAGLLLLGYLAWAATLAPLATLVRSQSDYVLANAVLALATLAPAMGLPSLLADPGGPAAVLLSFFPLSAPVVLGVRVLVAPVPAWQIGLGVAGMLGWTAGMVWLAARVFDARHALAGRSIFRELWERARSLHSAPLP